MACPDLCTAAKCEELENRIGALEQALELLEAAFEAHTQQDIPEAHGFNFEGNEPEPTEESEVNVEITSRGDNTFIVTVKVGNKQDSDGFTVSIPEIPEIPEPVEPEVSVSVSSAGEDNYDISVQVGEKLASDSFTVTHPDIPEIPEASEDNQHVESNLQGSASFNNGTLIINIADGESADTFQVSIPTNESPQTIFITEEVYMNCDQLENKFDDCCSQIIGALNNLSTQLTNVEQTINTEVQQIYNEVTIDITGTANSEYKCEFPTDEAENITPGYAESMVVEKTYSGKGLAGIHENLKLVNANLDKLHADVCKAVDPMLTITVDDLYKFCDDSGINRENYPDDPTGNEDYNEAVAVYLESLLSESKYAPLINGSVNGTLMQAPSSWVTPIYSDFALIQSRINNTKICDLEQDESDVVSIVASPKYVSNVDGKVLILHFVDLSNYPKRSKGSNYRQIQIPGAKDSYSWETDFEGLTWTRGNQYAELQLVGYRATVSGWFSSKDTADQYFDAVLNLTTASEKNRKYPEHKYPRTDIPVQITRPYRAFIESVNDQGQALCHVKYIPPIENE